MKKICLIALSALVLSAHLLSVLVFHPGLLKAEDLSSLLFGLPTEDFPLVSAEELALKKLLRTGWECDNASRHCTHFLINDSNYLLCVPTEIINGCLMVPLEHFCCIAGCGLEIGPDGKTRLIKTDVYVIEAGSPFITCGDKSWAFPVAPYKAHGFTYVPLRSMGDVLNLKVSWHAESDVVMIRSAGVVAEALQVPMTILNEKLLAALKDEEWPHNLEQMEITVTFYYYNNKNTVYTASGYTAVAGSVAADSGIPFGTQYYIPMLSSIREDCIFTVHDRGSKVTGNLIDVYVPNELRGDPHVSALLRRGKFKATAYLIPE